MNKKVIITICGAVIISSVLSISTCNSFSNNHKEINIITTTSPKSNYFIIPDSNTHYLTEDDLRGLTSDELEIARNEIYARHGYIFKNEDLYNYFMGCVWYNPTCKAEDFDDSVLNEYEKANLEILASMDTY